MISKGIEILDAKILILALLLENCPDVRNTKVVDLIISLKNNNNITIYDPWADKDEGKMNLA